MMRKHATYSIFIALVVSPLLLIGCGNSESKNGAGGSGGGTGVAGGMANLDGGGTGGGTGGAEIDGGGVDATVAVDSSVTPDASVAIDLLYVVIDTGVADAPIRQDAPIAFDTARIDVVDSASAGNDGAVCVIGDGGSGTLCSGVCVDTQVDPMNCGGCGASGAGVSCKAGAACASGRCQDVVGSLQGLRWSIPCTAAMDPAECDATSPAPQSTTVQGTAGVTYAVTLRFRGVVEQKTYSGRSDGGLAATGTNASFFVEGATPAGDGYNLYSLTISAPAQTAYLNSGTSYIGHCWPIDYTVTLPMQSNASVRLSADTVDGIEITNQDGNGNPIVVPEISPAPTAYNGQFIQMDVTNVVPML
jgi:hypothetical protein